MSLTGKVPLHPAEYSREVIEALVPHIAHVPHVHDPFAGRGVKLGALCDRLGVRFTGVDIDRYPDADDRVRLGDSTTAGPYLGVNVDLTVIVTSPTYLNGISSDYKQGPTGLTKLNGRHAYGISLGHALHPRNTARTVVRSRSDKGAPTYYAEHALAVKWWPRRCLVNVDLPMADDWVGLLRAQGYRAEVIVEIETRRVRGFDNAEKRARCEVLIQGDIEAG